MTSFDEIREHLDSSLSSPSSDEVMAYLRRWLESGLPLRLMLGPGYVNFPSLSDLPGRQQESSLPMPWRFASPESAARFCSMVEEAFSGAGKICHVER